MRNSKRFLGTFILGLIVFSVLFSNPFATQFLRDLNKNSQFPETSGYWLVSSIRIDEYEDGYRWVDIVANDWCSGNGTKEDPYLIENVTCHTISIDYSNYHFIIRNCTVSRNTGNPYLGAITLYNTSNGTIEYNDCSGSAYSGISLIISDNNTVRYNDASNCGRFAGVGVFQGSDYNRVIGNIATSSTYFGIYIDGRYDSYCTYNYVAENLVNDNGQNGILLDHSANYNIIHNNTIKNNNERGIYVNGGGGHCNYNNFTSNTIEDNSMEGLYLYGEWGECLGNLVSGNYFISNGGNARDDGSNNFWNSSDIGNYYNGYPYRDKNEDGIGDTPYSISGTANSIDYLPIWDDGIEAPPYFVSSSNPFSMIEGDPTTNITWIFADDNWNYDSYQILRNDTVVSEGEWYGNEIVYTPLYLLSPGHYEFTCVVNDTDDERVNSSVLVTVLTDSDVPIINIISPLSGSLYGISTPPSFSISIEELNIDSTWYRLNDGNNYTFTGYSGQINSSAWDTCSNGTVEIRFYANDTNGNLGESAISILKDTIAPIITIIEPIESELFGVDSPYYNISVVEPHLQTSYYRLNGGSNYVFSGTYGKIDQGAWDTCGNGSVIISFELWDAVGNWDVQNVTILKDIVVPNITINLPISFSLYSDDPPSFDLSINEKNMNLTWYTLNDGPRYYFTGSSGTISQVAWDACGNGTVTIKFYAKDLVNGTSMEEVTVLKDISAPIINILEPSPSDLFAVIPPTYNFTVQDYYLDTMWYTLNDSGDYIISSTYGQIDQVGWNLCSDGMVSIKIYSNDSMGNTIYEEVIVEKDSLLPEITINSPTSFQLFGLKAPEFNITINDIDLHTSWYTLNDGPITIFTGITGRFDQIVWNACGNGTVKITFYANNSLGNIASQEVTVRKETRIPDIEIISPLPSDTFGANAFQYEISVIEPSLDTMWYSLNNGANYSITNFTGTILQIAWDNCVHGSVLLTFYANNSVGNMGYTEIVIYKDLIGPSISIIDPNPMELWGNATFYFEIVIDDPDLDMTWYNLNGGINYFFTELAGTIDQSAWDACGNGTHTLTFYANDTYGNTEFVEVFVQKDVFLPSLTIELPYNNQWCGPLSASFDLSLIGNDVHTTWYTLNDLYMHEFTGTMGRIDQQSWDLFGEETISIKFYANNSAGNYIMKEVLVNKRLDIVSKNAYAIVIGVSNYPGSDYDLNYCDDDADDVYNMLINDYNFLPGNIILLKDSGASKSAIDNAFATINSMIGPDDVFYFYYSGHGGSEISTSTSSYVLNSPHPYPNYYDRTWSIYASDAAYIRVHFSTIDIESGYDYLYIGDAEIQDGWYYQALTGYATNYWSSWIPVLNDNRVYLRLISDYSVTYYGFRVDQIEVMRYSNPHYLCPYDSLPSSPSNYYLDTLLDSKLDSLNCNNIYAILDSCNSGGLIPEAQDTGRFIMTACRDGQVSYEDSYLQHGVFTNYLINSLDNANDQNSDGVISQEECYSYIYSRTGSYTASYGPGYQCHPQLSDGIAGQSVLYPSVGSLYTNAIDNKLYYSFYMYGHGTLRTLNLTVCSISPTVTFKTEEIKYQYVSPTGFGYYAGVIELDDGYVAGGIRLLAEVEGYGLVTIDLRYGDSDGDGLTDFYEILEGNGLDPSLNDTDGDGLLDGEELLTFNTDPLNPDTDSDGLLDGDEVNVYGSSPLLVDTDSDGISDYDEVITYGTYPMLADSDADGLNDYDEIFVHFTDPMNPDTDSDMVTDGNEINTYFTDPSNNDTDSDGLSDGEEIYTYFTDPLLEDTDSDGLTDFDEINIYGTDPLSADSDSDTMPDGWEICYSLDPLVNDSALDPDNDTLSNVLEYQYNTSPANNDTDSDFLLDGDEVFIYGTDPTLYDTDSDGLSDYDEVMTHFTDPTLADSDGDGISDYDEIFTYGTDPSNADTDSDTMPDGWEIDNFLDPFTNDTALDPDNDFLTNIEEFQHGTLAWNNDTDSDGLLDGIEVFTHNTDPTIDDTDSDGLLDGEEVNLYNTDPLDEDTDSDGLLDGEEVTVYNTDPLSGDTDSDTMPDKWEVDNSLNPLANDTMLDPDMDDLVNIEEYQHGTDPQNPDTDYDGWTDGEEIEEGTDPLDPLDHPSPPTPPPGGIPGYHLLIFLSIAGLISLFLVKKKRLKLIFN